MGGLIKEQREEVIVSELFWGRAPAVKLEANYENPILWTAVIVLSKIIYWAPGVA